MPISEGVSHKLRMEVGISEYISGSMGGTIGSFVWDRENGKYLFKCMEIFTIFEELSSALKIPRLTTDMDPVLIKLVTNRGNVELPVDRFMRNCSEGSGWIADI